MGLFPINPQSWLEGVCLDKYVQGMQTYQADMRHRMSEVRLGASEITRLGKNTRPIKIAVLSEDWCIDCLMTLPIMAQIAAAAPGMELRIFSRSHWPALKEYHNQRGVMAIPAFSFLDESFAEFATFVERPQSAHVKLNAWKTAHPEIEEIRRSFSMSSSEKKERLALIRVDMQKEMEKWYAEKCQSGMVSEVAALVGL